MSDIGKIAALAVAAAVCAVTIRKLVPEIALVLALAAGTLILLVSISTLSDVLTALREIAAYGGISQSLMEPVLKVVGIAIVTNITAEICKDAKEGGLASAVETAGTVLGLFTALPLAMSVLTLLSELL